MAVFSGLPLRITPVVAAKLLKTMIHRAMMMTVSQCCPSTEGCMSMPTDTKKTALKRCFNGVTRRCITSASMVSASMAPMTKAPRAVLKPALSASTTMPKQRPTATSSSVSSVMYFRIQRRKVGIRYIPNTNHTIRKKTSFTILHTSCPPSKVLLTLMVLNTTSSNTATISSTTSTPVTVEVNFCCLSFRSSKLLMMMAVDEMLSMQPRKMQSILLNPSRWPTVFPIRNMMKSSVRAVMAPVPPTFFNVFRLNSKPKANIRNTMPMSLHTCTLEASPTTGNQGK